jgi:hypothetical protein
MLLGKKTDEEREAQAAKRYAQDAEKKAQKEAKAREKLRKSFYESPAGQARVAFERGDMVFQYETNVRSNKAVVRSIGFGSSAAGKETLGSRVARGPVDTLNTVASEGWEIVSASFVFVQTGQESRDKFMKSGQQVAIAGTVMGYYVFKRNETLKTASADPWDVSADEVVALADQVDE